MPISKRKKETPAPQPPYQKTPQQLEQWAAYMVLCAQREDEAKAKVAHLRKADDLATQAGKHAQAQQIRQFAEVVMSRLDAKASPKVRRSAEEWLRETLALADRIDPIQLIILSFDSNELAA